MSKIKRLPYELINQIAAGEIIERPSSIVKELIENSIDAGSNIINIEIKNGGMKYICINDNGIGISKEDLSLAFQKYATSKISTLQDLESIKSMGFRGEALASISSISRVILTSKIKTQKEAWKIYLDNSNIPFQLKPAAHPTGTTIEIFDLFYNIPARRKFLRTEKTEFNYINEIIRKIALSHFHISFNLKHNNKYVHKYKAIDINQKKHEQRIIDVLGENFIDKTFKLYWENNNVTITGWIANPYLNHSREIQYCYVNNRIIRNKLINHAIRQAYTEQILEVSKIIYIIYLKINPYNIDINVHPTKQEVKFHESRLVHDLIYHCISTILIKNKKENITHTLNTKINKKYFIESSNKSFIINNNEKYFTNTKIHNPLISTNHNSFLIQNHMQFYNIKNQSNNLNTNILLDQDNDLKNIVCSLEKKTLNFQSIKVKPLIINQKKNNIFYKILTIYKKYFAVIETSLGIGLLSLNEMYRYLIHNQLIFNYTGLKSKLLILPIKLLLTEKELLTYHKIKNLLIKLGFNIIINYEEITITGAPCYLNTENINVFLKFIKYLELNKFLQIKKIIIEWVNYLVSNQSSWTINQAKKILIKLENIYPELIQHPPKKLIQFIDFQLILTILKEE